MTAHVGDEIVLVSQPLHQPVRAGEILEVRDGPGGPVYLVQWSDNGPESLLWPGADAVIKHLHGCGEHAREVVIGPRL
jgi:hypothetical protein